MHKFLGRAKFINPLGQKPAELVFVLRWNKNRQIQLMSYTYKTLTLLFAIISAKTGKFDTCERLGPGFSGSLGLKFGALKWLFCNFLWFGLYGLGTKKDCITWFLSSLLIIKKWKYYEILGFSSSGHCLAFKKFFF